jgi:hypothetical protein
MIWMNAEWIRLHSRYVGMMRRVQLLAFDTDQIWREQ